MIVPASSTVMIRRKNTLPVSVSTSTTATCVPNGNVGPGAVNTLRTNSRSDSARLVSGTETSGSPLTLKVLVSTLYSRSAGRGLEGGGRPLAGHVEQLAGRLLDGRAAELERARAAGAAALGDQVGVAPLDGDLLDRDAELLADEHRPHRLVALAMR